MHTSRFSPEGSTLKKLLIIGTGGTIAGVGAVPGSPVGYRAGALPIDQLLDTVPGLSTLGELRAEQVFSIPSEQMDGAHWLHLAARLRQILSQPAGVDAIVITHGTDTMEETAFFLSLLLPARQPVILTGAMRPSTALDADGPGNLYKACRLALAATERGIGGTFVAFGEQVFCPDAVVKQHANAVLAFGARHGQPVAWMENDRPVWRRPTDGLQAAFAQLRLPALPPLPVPGEAAGTASADGKAAEAGADDGGTPRRSGAAPAQSATTDKTTDKAGTTRSVTAEAAAQPLSAAAPAHSLAPAVAGTDEFPDTLAGPVRRPAPGSADLPMLPALQTLLPTVALVTQHVDADPALVDWLLSRGCRGIVLAGTGIGTMPVPMRAALVRARRRGCLVVRASRVPQGHVGRNTEADPADSDEALDFITAGWLDPLKARILLQLCLLAGNTDSRAIQALFDRCGP